jgi:hypothetical protein
MPDLVDLADLAFTLAFSTGHGVKSGKLVRRDPWLLGSLTPALRL